jgi:phenylalanyl-tRNA synthetase beta chain
VRVVLADGQTSVVYPELAYRKESVSVVEINKRIGISESADSIASLLTRMCLKSGVSEDGQNIVVEVSNSGFGFESGIRQ